MQRRSFLAAMLAAAAAPAIVRSGVLMPVKAPIWTPPAADYGFIGVDLAAADSDASVALYTGEIGRWENIRFIESPLTPAQRNQVLDGSLRLTREKVAEVVRAMNRAQIPGDYAMLVHPTVARELRETLPGMRAGKR
jgi:hypothetical protein